MKRCKLGDLVLIIRDDLNPVNIGMFGMVVEAVSDDRSNDWEIVAVAGQLYETTEEDGSIVMDDVMLMPDSFLQPIRGVKPQEKIEDLAHA